MRQLYSSILALTLVPVAPAAGVAQRPTGAIMQAQQPVLNLAGMDDRAIIIIGGRQVTVAQLKQSIAAQPASAAREGLVKDVLAQDDKAIIIIGGRQVAAAALKQAVNAELAKRSVPPQQPIGGVVRNPADRVGLNPQPLPPKLATDIFAMDDKAMVTVGGKQVAAGDIKRDLIQRIPPPSGPPQVMLAQPRRAVPPQVPSVTSTLTAPGGGEPVRQDAGPGDIAGLEKRRADAREIDCTSGPIMGQTHGALAPGEPLRIVGACFGPTAGAVEVLGQFMGYQGSGRITLEILSWHEGEIVARVPPGITNVADHLAGYDIARADGKRSKTRQAPFTARRERVEVPAELWSPASHFTWRGVYEHSSGITGSSSSGAGAPPNAAFRLRINPACALDNMETSARFGAVTGIYGWESGSPFDVSVTINWRAREDRTESDYLVGYKVVYVDTIDFSLRAWAYCPVGIKP